MWTRPLYMGALPLLCRFEREHSAFGPSLWNVNECCLPVSYRPLLCVGAPKRNGGVGGRSSGPNAHRSVHLVRRGKVEQIPLSRSLSRDMVFYSFDQKHTEKQRFQCVFLHVPSLLPRDSLFFSVDCPAAVLMGRAEAGNPFQNSGRRAIHVLFTRVNKKADQATPHTSFEVCGTFSYPLKNATRRALIRNNRTILVC